jgi:hypothetical protein
MDEARDRRAIHDDSSRRPGQEWLSVLDAEPGSLDVHVEDPVPDVFVQVIEGARVGQLGVYDPGIVVQDVQDAVCVVHDCHQSSDVIAPADVAMHVQAVSPECTDLLRNRAPGIIIHVGHDHCSSALATHLQCGCTAHPAAAAGHDANLVCEH